MPRYFLDVSDVVEYFGYNLAASGIQRVQLEFIRYFSKLDRATNTDDIFFVIENAGAKGFTVVDNAALGELVSMLDHGAATRKALDAVLARIRSAKEASTPEADDIFFVSGAFWASSSTSRSLWNARRSGARVGFLCYDLIPIRNREFCDAGLVKAFQAAIINICHVVDFVFTISEYVKTDVEQYLATLKLDVPVIALPLAHELAPASDTAPVRAEVRDLLKKRYVLFVSTIEARKNHAYTLAAWQKLIELHGPDKVPDLVWVGRAGWLVNDLITRVDRLDRLDGKLHILRELNDSELKALYQSCWLTIYPSLAEGWGLPVAESLMFGRPSIASDITSVPEVGGDFVWYIDPLNVSQGVALLSDLIAHPAKVDAAAERIRTSFRPRTWGDVCENLLAGFRQLARQPRQEIPSDMPLLETGRIYALDGSTSPIHASLPPRQRVALELMFDDHWYGAENWGRWLKGTSANIALTREARAAGGQHRVFLKLNTVGHWKGRHIYVSCPTTKSRAACFVRPGGRYDLICDLVLPAGPTRLEIAVDRADAGPGADVRPLSIGLVSLGYAKLNDTKALAGLMAMLGQGTEVVHGTKGRPPIAAAQRQAVRNEVERFKRYYERARLEGRSATMQRVARRMGLSRT